MVLHVFVVSQPRTAIKTEHAPIMLVQTKPNVIQDTYGVKIGEDVRVVLRMRHVMVLTNLFANLVIQIMLLLVIIGIALHAVLLQNTGPLGGEKDIA